MSFPSFILNQTQRNPGKIVRLGPLFIVSDPHHVEEVLVHKSDCFGKGGGMWKALRPLLGQGLITAEGDDWREQRRLMQPMFSRQRVSEYVPSMTKIIEAECDRIEQGPSVIDIAVEMRQISQRVLLHTLFGMSSKTALGDHLHTALSALNLRLFLYFLPTRLIPGQRRFESSIAAIDSTIAGLKTSFLADCGLTPKELRDQLVTLYVAGSDTIASTLTWLWCALATFPQERDTDVHGLLQETLRLWPPIWFFPRFVTKATEIGGRKIAAKSVILLCPLATQRDSRFWDSPTGFSPSKRSQQHRFAFYPFGAGSRKCLGEHFGFAEMDLVIRVLAKRFRFERVAQTNLSLRSETTLWPKRALLRRVIHGE